jgi:hypothetical protein
MTYTTVVLPLAFLSLVVMANPATAQDDDSTRRTLRGLPGVEVGVEPIPRDGEDRGLTTKAIQIDVELQLRLAGIRVLTDSDVYRPLDPAGRPSSAATARRPYLYVIVNVFGRNNTWAYAIEVTLRQDAVLANGVTAWADTWSVGGVGLAGADLRGVRDVVKDNVNQFINAWLSVNPKR